MQGTRIGRSAIQRMNTAVIAAVFIPIPALHPLLIPFIGPPSHLMWWIYVVPVALVSYTFGVRWAAVATLASVLLLIAGERRFGYGYDTPASWETTVSLAVALGITLLLIAALSAYAGHAARKLRLAAFTHPLTQLPNRRQLETEVALALGRPQRNLALLFLGIDDFDAINYTLGYGAGDKVLIELAARLHQSLEASEVFAHLTGDEFAVCRRFDHPEEIDTLVGRLRNALLQPLQIDGMELRAMSVGIGIANARGIATAQTLLQNAGTALSHAKQTGRSGLSVFSHSMQEKAEKRLSILNDLSGAIEQEQLTNSYQPIHDARSGAIAGVEALVRWNHPQKGGISPAEFIPLSEQAGLIGKLGRAVMERALDDFLRWREQGLFHSAHFITINVSPLQLLEPGYSEGLEQATRLRGLEPENIVVEITETAMMQSEQVSLKVLEQLNHRGFRVAIDDFGSGYSSLNYLHKLPVRILKIDRLLVEQLDSKSHAPLIRPILDIARSLGLKVIAEGVETREQRDQLALMGADLLQGFHLSKPMPSADLVALLHKEPRNGGRKVENGPDEVS